MTDQLRIDAIPRYYSQPWFGNQWFRNSVRWPRRPWPAEHQLTLCCSGAACEAAKEGLASTAFSGKSTTQEAFTNLAQTPNSSTILAARTYAELTTFFTTELLASPARPIIPPNITLNVNLAPTTDCPTASDFSFVLTRLLPDASATDVEICGTDHLPDETTVINSGCFVTISVMNAVAKTDVDAKTQAAILRRIAHILTCVS